MSQTLAMKRPEKKKKSMAGLTPVPMGPATSIKRGAAAFGEPEDGLGLNSNLCRIIDIRYVPIGV